jgi:uncharacterized phage-like protein YoqJ
MIKEKLREQIEFLISNNVTVFYTGMAMGVDMWAASIVLELKAKQPNIQLIAIVPCKNQANRWPQVYQEKYNEILAQCDDTIILHEKYTRSCMFERNRYMVDNSSYLLSVFDGSDKGGTAYTTKYAQKKGNQVIIIHPDTFTVTKLHG